MLIYKATNLINGKIYIGQTTLSLEERIKYHKRDSQRLDTYFYRAIKKYGWEAFKWEVIHDNIKTIEELDELEKYYIALYDTFDNPKKGYNTQSGGHHFKLTAEECKKRSERAKGESNPMYGKPGTWLRKHFSEEHKANLSKSLSGKTRSSTIGENNPAAKKIINLSTGEIFGCIKDACEKYQISNTALVNNIKGKTKLCCGCTWSYYDSTQNYPIVSTSSSVQIRNPKKQIYVLELDTVFPTAVAAAKAINCDNSLISKKCKTVSGENYAIVKGYHVRYI